MLNRCTWLRLIPPILRPFYFLGNVWRSWAEGLFVCGRTANWAFCQGPAPLLALLMLSHCAMGLLPAPHLPPAHVLWGSLILCWMCLHPPPHPSRSGSSVLTMEQDLRSQLMRSQRRLFSMAGSEGGTTLLHFLLWREGRRNLLSCCCLLHPYHSSERVLSLLTNQPKVCRVLSPKVLNLLKGVWITHAHASNASLTDDVSPTVALRERKVFFHKSHWNTKFFLGHCVGIGSAKAVQGDFRSSPPSLPCHGNICPCCVPGSDSRLELPRSLAGAVSIWGCGVSPKFSPGETRWITRSALEQMRHLNPPAPISWAGWTPGCSRQVWELAGWCGLYYGTLALLKCCFSFASKTLLGSWRSGSHPLLKTGILKSRK